MDETVRVGEYADVELHGDLLTDSDMTLLERLQEKHLLRLSRTPSGHLVSARSTVGVVVLDRVRLLLEPKLPVSGRGLIDWLRYAAGARTVSASATRRWQTGPSGFADLVIGALLEECLGLSTTGLRRDYVERRGVEAALRGRLDVVAQATRRYGMVDRLHVRAHERSTDIWENQVCATALSAALPLVHAPTLARALSDCARAFPRPIHRGRALRHLEQARYTRLNERYRSAHVWAGLLLGGGGVRDLLSDGDHDAGTLLLPMPALWEKVVTRMCREAMGGGLVSLAPPVPSLKVTGDLFPRGPFRPDVLVSGGGATMAVDAKYKDYTGKGVSSSDVHQLLTYCAWYTPEDPRAVIVYPSERGTTRRTLRAGDRFRTLGTIDVVGVDAGAPPEDAVPRLRSVLTRLAVSSAR